MLSLVILHCLPTLNASIWRCKKTKEKAASRKRKDAAFLWYNVIVQKQNPQEYYTAYQLKLPVEISDPVYSFSEVMDHIDLNKYLTIEERRTD